MGDTTLKRFRLSTGSAAAAAGAILRGLLLLAAILVVVPFSPAMPGESLDPSWMTAMNQAVSQSMAFGRDIVYTFGPYASIYTTVFHPATDGMMLWGSLYLGLSLGTAILLLLKGAKWYWVATVLLVLASLTYSRDALLFYYPLVVGLYCYRLALHNEPGKNEGRQTLLLTALFFPFGLLPLIKGSLLVLCAAIAGLASAYFLANRNWKSAALVAASPVAATMFFWMLAGQPLSGLPSFLVSMIAIISGYTEAMALDLGPRREVIGYIVASVALLWLIYREDRSPPKTRLFLILVLFVSLFLAFKGGFVRHDAHALVANTLLLMAALLSSALLPSRRTILALCLSAVVWVNIDHHYMKTGIPTVVTNFTSTYLSGWNAIAMRLNAGGKLENDYREAMGRLDRKAGFPKLAGSTDIYSFNQSYLIASNNTWNPRPVFQSFAAYTPSLAEKNRQHLLGTSAPDNIIFTVETIDSRLPSIDDGASWPVILANYQPAALENDFLFLRKNNLRKSPALSLLKSEEKSLGEVVSVPGAAGAIFAEIDLRPSLLGRMAAALYKPSQLEISVDLENGMTRNFTVISGMTRTGFLISPLVENTPEFGFLYGGARYLPGKRVKSFTIRPARWNGLWNSAYQIKFFEMALPGNEHVAQLIKVDDVMAPPAGSRAKTADTCDGNIELANGPLPTPPQFAAGRVLKVQGWFAVSAEKGLIPDRVLLAVTDAQGRQSFAKTQRTQRLEIGSHYGKPQLNDSGFISTVDVSKIKGRYTLGLAYEQAGQLRICPKFAIPGNFSGN